jgi:hypothetical protein
MVNIHAIALFNTSLSDKGTSRLVALHNAILVLDVVPMIHLVYLVGRPMRTGIAHLAPVSK